MKYYPIFLDVKTKSCLVIGGGPVGARKAVILEKCGASVTVLSEHFDDLLVSLKGKDICLGAADHCHWFSYDVLI